MHRTSPSIVSPVPSGSGAIVVHRQLEAALPGYRVAPYSPRLEWFPWLLCTRRPSNADLIHTTSDYGSLVASRSSRLVVTCHNYLLDRFMRPYSSALQRLHYRTNLRYWTRRSLQRASIVTAVSRFTADLVASDLQYPGAIRVIPNGVDTKRFRPASSNDRRGLRVLVSGNLTIRKGVHWLQPIAKRLDPEIRILCASGLRGRDVRWDADNIQSLGRVSWQDMPQLYQSVDVVLMPTVREGMSLAVLEAMACGLPVVATDCSSLPEQVHHGQGGFLCRLGAVVEFAEALNVLNQDRVLCRQMGEYNRVRAETAFTLDLVAERYRDVFDEVLEQ